MITKKTNNRTMEQIFRDDDQEEEDFINLNKFNEEYKEHPKKKEEYPILNFIDYEKYGVSMENE